MTKQWKPIPQEPDYEISDCGDIRRLTDSTRGKRGDPVRNFNCDGYRTVVLCHKGKVTHYRVHRLVLAAFAGISDSFVNHKNGVRHDNRLSNLEYCTHQENLDHARFILGKRHTGSLNSNAKLTESLVQEAFSLHASGIQQKDIAAKLSVSKATICKILKGKMWGHVSIPPTSISN